MEQGDIYVCIEDKEYFPDFNVTGCKLFEFEKYVIINPAPDWDHCYVMSKTIINGIIIKCMKSSLISVAEYRKIKIDSLL